MKLITGLILAVVSLSIIGCNGFAPPQTFVQAMRNSHNQSLPIYQQFEAQNPAEAQTASDLWNSEEILIAQAEGNPPATQPVATQPPFPPASSARQPKH